MLERDSLEVFWQRRRSELPIAIEIWSSEPSTRHQIVDWTLATHPKQITLGVADPHEARSRNGNVVWFSIDQDELSRRNADVDLRNVCCRLAGKVRLYVLPVFVVRKFRETVGELRCW
jgi:hypothetical protein